MVEVTNVWDSLCHECIALMTEMSHSFGISYGMLNILLFVIIGPLSTLSFAFATLFAWLKNKSKVFNVFSIILAIIGLICLLAVILPILYIGMEYIGNAIYIVLATREGVPPHLEYLQ